MTRSVPWLLAGAIAGGAAVWLLEIAAMPDSTGGPVSPDPAAAAAPVVAPPAADARSGGYATQRLAIYEEAARAADAGDVEALIEAALGEPPSRLRDLKLTALLSRLAELDPKRAVDFSRSVALETEFVVPLFRLWAARDADAAIRELALVSPRAGQRDIALAILAVIGNDAEGFERVAAALSAADRGSFEIDALLARAETEPAVAFEELNAPAAAVRRSILLYPIAEVLARTDPQGALALSASIDDYSLQRTFRNSLFYTWARLDAEAVFDWIETAEIIDLPEVADVYQLLASVDSDRLFALLDVLPPAIRTNAESGAMRGLAETDAPAAIARLETMPPGRDRDNLLSQIAQAYGRQSPDLALAWARSLPQAETQGALRAVMIGILNVDAGRVIDLIVAGIESGTQQANPAAPAATPAFDTGLLMMASMVAGRTDVDFSRVADSLLNANQAQAQSLLSSTIGSWARADPDAALGWARANADRLAPDAFSRIAQGIAQTDLARALALLDQTPPTQQAQWATGLVQQMAQNDPAGAMNLLERFRGLPEYAGAYGAVAQTLARTDPAAAVAVLRDAPGGNSSEIRSASLAVAREWSRRDPAAAADWALGLVDPGVQGPALTQIASGWAERDMAAAERWLLGMSPGAARDAALDGFFSAAAEAGRFEPRLLDAYSTPDAGQRGAARAIQQIGRTNPGEARRLLDLHITDDVIRRQTEAALARTGGLGGA